MACALSFAGGPVKECTSQPWDRPWAACQESEASAPQAQAFDERSAWKSCAEVSRHRHLMSAQRGFSTCRMTPALSNRGKSRKPLRQIPMWVTPSDAAKGVTEFRVRWTARPCERRRPAGVEESHSANNIRAPETTESKRQRTDEHKNHEEVYPACLHPVCKRMTLSCS